MNDDVASIFSLAQQGKPRMTFGDVMSKIRTKNVQEMIDARCSYRWEILRHGPE